MKTKSILVIIFIPAFLVTVHAFARLQVQAHRSNYSYRLNAAVFPVSNEMISALAGEFKGMVANYLMLEAANFIGSPQSADASAEEWSVVTKLLDQSNYLDPYFKSTYRLAQSVLPWEAQEYDGTLSILERSKSKITWSWEPGFFIGFNYYFFLKDNLTASKKLMEASKIKGAPSIIATLAARLASQAGQTRIAIDFLITLYEQSDDENLKEILQERILALQGVEILQSAVSAFEARFERLPNSLDELVEQSVLPSLPTNPYDRPYTLKDGMIHF